MFDRQFLFQILQQVMRAGNVLRRFLMWRLGRLFGHRLGIHIRLTARVYCGSAAFGCAMRHVLCGSTPRLTIFGCIHRPIGER